MTYATSRAGVVFACALACLIGINAASAETVPALGADQERVARDIEQNLIAPCCWRQQVAVHDSPAAQEIKADVRVRLARGESRDTILAAYEKQYGAAILVEPPAKGFSLALYVLPPIVLALSGVLLVVLVRRFTRSRMAPAVAHAEPAPTLEPAKRAEYDRRVDDALDDLD